MSSGVTRPVDQLGRVVIPCEIRKSLHIAEGDLLEVSKENDCIILKRAEKEEILDVIKVKEFLKEIEENDLFSEWPREYRVKVSELLKMV